MMHHTQRPNRPSRRDLLRGVARLSLSVAGGALLAGCANQAAPFVSGQTGGQLEATRIRLYQAAGLCVAPQYMAGDLLRAEGFTDIQYVRVDPANPYPSFTSREIDISMAFAAPFLMQVDQGSPVVLLGGVHTGCFEVFGNDSVQAFRDLKGKTVGVPGIGSAGHVFLASIAAYVGLDPRVDLNWFVHPAPDSARVLADGTVDALIGFPPIPQDLRAKNVGHVVVNSSVDRPWSQTSAA